jgi:hypothetical protein
MKKSLLFGLLAVLAAVFIFTACDNGSTSSPTTITDKVPIEVDVVVTTEADLRAVLDPDADPSWEGEIIGLNVPGGGTLILTADLIIPAGYKVFVIGNTTLSTDGTQAPGGANDAGLTVEGHVRVLAEATLKVPEDGEPIVVKGDGSILVEYEGNLDLYKVTDINDGTTPRPATVLNTDKVKVTGGTLTLAAFTKMDDLSDAFGSVESGDLVIDGIKPIKPSQITGFDTNKDRRITVTVAKGETEATLHVPKGMTLTATGPLTEVTTLTVDGKFTATGSIPKLTDLTISGEFDASGNTFLLLKTLTVEAGGKSALASTFTVLDTLVVNGTLDTAGSTFTVPVNVTVGAAGELGLAAATLKDESIINGKLHIVGNITVGSNAVLNIVDPSKLDTTPLPTLLVQNPVATSSVIFAEGSTAQPNAQGTITTQGFEGYTTALGGSGIDGDVFKDALKAIDKDYVKLLVTTGLDDLFGDEPVDIYAIGSTTLTDVADTASVYYNGTGNITNVPPTNLPRDFSTGFTLEPSYVSGFVGDVLVDGEDATDVDEGDFTPSLSGNDLQITDSGTDTADGPKYVILVYKNYLPANSGLIGPQDYLVSISVGILTER